MSSCCHVALLALLTAASAFAESTRELDAHEHGVGSLNIAVDGDVVAMIERYQIENQGAEQVAAALIAEFEKHCN